MDEKVEARQRRRMAAEVASHAAIAGGLGLLTDLAASAHGWPVPARVAVGLVPAVAGIAVPYLMTMFYIAFNVDNDPIAARVRVDDPAKDRWYRLPTGLIR